MFCPTIVLTEISCYFASLNHTLKAGISSQVILAFLISLKIKLEFVYIHKMQYVCAYQTFQTEKNLTVSTVKIKQPNNKYYVISFLRKINQI